MVIRCAIWQVGSGPGTKQADVKRAAKYTVACIAADHH